MKNNLKLWRSLEYPDLNAVLLTGRRSELSCGTSKIFGLLLQPKYLLEKNAVIEILRL